MSKPVDDDRRSAEPAPRTEDELRELAYRDHVTGLPNRLFLHDRIEQCIKRAARVPDFRFAVLYLDLDNFKKINDTLGHDRGDILLRQVSSRIQTCLRSLDSVVRREEETAARVGGDEFIILLEGVSDSQDSVRVAERVAEALSMAFVIDGREVFAPASIGIAVNDRRYTRASDILHDADTAMYRAKSAGAGHYALFNPEMHRVARERLQVENKLREAVDDLRMRIAYQPIIEIATGRVAGVEALVRCPLDGIAADTQTIVNVAEETGLIVRIGRWVLSRAALDVKRWLAIPGVDPELRVSINLSPREIGNVALVEMFQDACERARISPDRLAVELPERVLMECDESSRIRLNQLRDLGIALNLDDFGSGHSSLTCLRRLELHTVKIDRQFTSIMFQDERYVAMARSIVDLCHALGPRVTVEGVETEEQLETVRSLGCDHAQGFLFARPMDSGDIERLLQAQNSARDAA